MQYFLSFCIIFGLISCASKPDLDVVHKLDRVSIDQTEYHNPDFFIKTDIKEMLNSRSPASFNVSDKTYGQLSNRQVYFLSLFDQYQTMNRLAGYKEDTNSCPAFHDLILRHYSKVDSDTEIKNQNYSAIPNDPTMAVYFPAMALPYTKNTDLYTALNADNWSEVDSYLKTALMNYTDHLKVEVHELCDTGVSKGYYLYENVVTYFKNDKNFHKTKKGLAAVLKIPVFANLIIIDQLQAEVGYKGVAQDLLGRGELLWFNSFRESINFGRNQNIVKR